jgi:hypothetical protein
MQTPLMLAKRAKLFLLAWRRMVAMARFGPSMQEKGDKKFSAACDFILDFSVAG